MPKLTKRAVDAAVPRDKIYSVPDGEIPGYHLRVSPSGGKVFYLSYRNAAGRKQNFKIGAMGAVTPAAARQRAWEISAGVAVGKDPSAERAAAKTAPTMQDLRDRYMDEHGNRKKSAYNDALYFDRFILPALGTKKKVRAVEHEDMAALHRSLADRPYLANRVRALASTAFGLAETWRDGSGFWRTPGTNPCANVKRYPEEKRRRYLSPEELKRLGTVLDEWRNLGGHHAKVATLIMLLILTGARRSEISGARWEWISWDRGVLILPDSKTGAKEIRLASPALAILSAMADQREPGAIYVFPGVDPEQPLKNPKRAWHTIRKRAGLGDLHMHDLRHTFASFGLLRAGGSLEALGGLLGHSDARTTQRYAHLMDGGLDRLADQTARHIEDMMGRE